MDDVALLELADAIDEDRAEGTDDGLQALEEMIAKVR